MSELDDLQRRLRHLGTQPIDPGRQSADLTAMAGVGGSSRRPGLFGSKLRLAGAFLAGLLIGSTGLAAADALPDPAQHVAHTVLAQVGVDVPNPERYHGTECGGEVKKNHGAYVRDDHALAQSDCGKPIGGAAGGGDDTTGGGNGNAGIKGPCQGRPPWAGNKSMTDAEVAAAKAERAALCGTEVDDDADELEDEAEEPDETDAEDPAARGSDTGEPTTTTSPTTTTTQAPTTTTTEATTTTGAAPTTSTTT